MSKIGMELVTDCSTHEAFSFSLRCEACGAQWCSKPVRFSRAGLTPKSEGKQVIFQTLYQREKVAALQRAAREAAKVFNHCPICHRLVCDRCFMVCEELDMCTSCALRLREPGEPVEL